MVQYLKVRLYNASRGTVTCDALVFKMANFPGPIERASFIVVSNNPVRNDWNECPADGQLGVPVYDSDGVRTIVSLRAGETPFYYKYVTLDSDHPEWMSITSFCAFMDMDEHSSVRVAAVGDNTVDPYGCLTFDNSEEFNVHDVFAPRTASSSSRTTDGPAVARTSTESVAILEGYTRTEMYSGFGGYHSNQRSHRFNTPLVADKPWRIGIELEVYARSREAFNTITGARSNWFQCERDGSLGQAEYPIELKTIPLRACDAKSVDFWDAPMRRLASLAKSKEYRSTGLHVHIGKEILGSNTREQNDTLNKLCWFYVYRVESNPDAHAKNVTMAGREHGYAGTLEDSKAELANFAELVGYKAACGNKQAFDMMAGQVRQKTASQRWDINIQHLNDYGTIEFRKGDGRISKTRLAGLVTWWEQMVLYCRNHSQDQLDFDDFFAGVCAEYPAVAYFFTQDEEA